MTATEFESAGEILRRFQGRVNNFSEAFQTENTDRDNPNIPAMEFSIYASRESAGLRNPLRHGSGHGCRSLSCSRPCGPAAPVLTWPVERFLRHGLRGGRAPVAVSRSSTHELSGEMKRAGSRWACLEENIVDARRSSIRPEGGRFTVKCDRSPCSTTFSPPHCIISPGGENRQKGKNGLYILSGKRTLGMHVCHAEHNSLFAPSAL